MCKLGVVSFLNSRPLIAGLSAADGFQCLFDVPAALPQRLDQGEWDAALVPLIDVLRAGPRWHIVSDACIASDGETMTVRVFSQVPPDRMRTLWVDPDSHTSVILARILWRGLYNCELELRPIADATISDLPSVLLIGDKVVDPRRAGFAYEVDLGGAWRAHTGLPFVFAVWAGPIDRDPVHGRIAAALSAARDRGVAQSEAIARRDGPALGWPVELAVRYLTRCLQYKLTPRMRAGAELCAQRCAELGLVPAAHLPWPDGPAAPAAGAAPACAGS